MKLMWSGWGVRHADGEIHCVAGPRSRYPKIFDDRELAERLIKTQELEGAKIVKVHIAIEDVE